MMEKPRLLQMMLSTQSGGAETFFEKLALAFADAGIPQCLVIEPNPEREALFSNQENVDLVTIPFGGLKEWAARRHLKTTFRRFLPELALTWMNRASRRVPEGYCPVVGRLGGYYKLRHYQNCDHLIGITPDLREHIVSGGWAAENSSMIPNFGEVANPVENTQKARQEIRREQGIDASATVLLALGRLHEVKAHDVLIRALAKVERGIHLLIAGEGPLRSELQALTEELGIAHFVHFLGWRRDTGRLFAACDISVFPSRYEPNGTVVMESWAQGKPLIASKAKGPEWLVDDGQDGLLFEIDAVDQLADQIRKLTADPDLCKQLVSEGRKKWKKSFSKEAVVAQYLSLFEQLRAGSD